MSSVVDNTPLLSQAASTSSGAPPKPSPPLPHTSTSASDATPPKLSSLPFPAYTAGFLSVLFFHWVGPLLDRARDGPITAADLFAAPFHMRSAYYTRQLHTVYRQYINSAQPPARWVLLRAIFRAYRRRFFYPLWTLRSLHLCLVITRPIVLRQLLLWVEYSEASIQGSGGGDGGSLFSFDFASWTQVEGGVYWAVVLSLMTMCQATVAHHFWWRGMQLAVSTRGACIGLIYSKALTMHTRYRAEYSSGRISNLASVDADAFLSFFWDPVFELCFAPLTISLCIAGLVFVLGWSAMVGVAVLLLSLLITTYTARKQSQVQEINMTLSDQRVSAVQEMLTSIKLIKLYSWQLPFHRVISRIRSAQEVQLWRTQLISAVNHCLGMTTTLFVSLASFYTYHATTGALDATTAFTALMLFNQLRAPLYNLPDSISALVNLGVSQARIETFLACADREEYVKVGGGKDGEVVVEDGAFDWGGGRAESEEEEMAVSKTATKRAEGADTGANGHRSDHHAIAVHESAYTAPVAPVLQSLNIRFPPHLLTLIIGKVGAGKSSLLLSLLSEMHQQHGTVTMPQNQRRTAYTAQVAFLASASIRSNILFGLPFEPSWYARVLEACALDVDVERFAAGDATVVGENGLTLSGGQKMRVSLARAVYARADVYLLDEPLGAVDAHVGLHLFDRLFGADGLLRGRTVLLVTHQVQFAPRCPHIVMMDGGRVVEAGSYEQLQAKGIDFSAIVADAHTGSEVVGAEDESEEERKEAPQWLPPASPHEERKEAEAASSETAATTQHTSPTSKSPRATPAASSTAKIAAAASSTTVAISHTSTNASEDITEETLNVGSMRWNVYRQYLLSGTGLPGWAVVLVLLVTSEGAIIGSEYVLAALTSAASEDQLRFLQYYAYLLVASAVLLFGRCAYLAYVCLTSANTLHRRLFVSMLRAPQWWHEVTPTGRILNRVGKDQTSTDQQLPSVMQEVAACAAGVFGMLGLIVLVIPFSLPFFLVIAAVYRWIQRNYRPATVALKRLESVTRSPMYQHLAETATGLLTIRAYESFGSVSRAIRECYHRIDLNSQTYINQFACHRWMGLRLEALGAATVLTCTTVSLFMLPSLSAGLVGLLVTTALSLTGDLHWLVRQRTEMEVQLNAVERIIEYASVAPEESDERWNTGVLSEQRDEQRRNHATATGPASPRLTIARLSPSNAPLPARSMDVSPLSKAVLIPPLTWPEHGRIEFHSLTAAYRPPPDDVAVLHELSAVINAGEKVGIVGRTGAGKSTVSLCLFRLMEAKSGYISIDGLPIHRIPLHLLRSKLMIVPQDPVLFAHSLRYNLDPFSRCSDAQLWSVLEQVGLKELVGALPGQLEWKVSDGGENLSVGQRQLLCLARALLRRCRVVVMDEASASLDLESDSVMKRVIAREFEGCTVLTIAHRLNTVLTSDRIMVFDAGRLREFDKPAVLLRDKDGLLAQLLSDAQSMTSEVRKGRSEGSK